MPRRLGPALATGGLVVAVAGGAGATGSSGGRTAGTVASVDGSTVCVTDANGNLVKVTIPDGTSVSATRTGTAADVRPGDTIVVVGTQQPDGSTQASSVQVNPTFGGAGFGGRLRAAAPGPGARGPPAPRAALPPPRRPAVEAGWAHAPAGAAGRASLVEALAKDGGDAVGGVLEALFVVVAVAAALDVVGVVRRRRRPPSAVAVTPWLRTAAPRPSGPAAPVEGRVLFLQLDEEAGLVGLDLVESRSGAPSHVTGVVSSHAIGRWAAEAAARWVERGSDVRAEVSRSQVVLHAADSMLRLDLAPEDRRAA